MTLSIHHAPRALTLTLLAILLGSLVTACAGGLPTPTVDYKADYDFTPVKKIAFYEDSGQVIGDNPLQLSDMQRDRINDALAFALKNKGFEMVEDASKADLLLSWSLFTQEKTDINTWNTMSTVYGGYYSRYNIYSGYNCWNCMGGETEISIRDYTEGTFIVDLIDPKLHKSVWRSLIQSRMNGNQVENQDRYNAAATAIFASFPPGSAE